MPEERKYRWEDFGLIGALFLLFLLLLLCALGILCPKINCPEGTYRCDVCPEGCCLPGGYCPCPEGTDLCSKNCPQTINCPTGCCTKDCECSDKRCLRDTGCSCVGMDCNKCIGKRCGGVGPAICESDGDCEGIRCSKEGCKRPCTSKWQDCNGDGNAECRSPNICFKKECSSSGCKEGFSDCDGNGDCECPTKDGRYICCGGKCIDTQSGICYKDPNRKSCPPEKNGVDGCYDFCCPPNSKGWDPNKDCCVDVFGNCMFICTVDESRVGCGEPNVDACDENGCCPKGAVGWDPGKECCVDANNNCMYRCQKDPSLDGCPPNRGNCPVDGCCPKGSKWGYEKECCVDENNVCICTNPEFCNPLAGRPCCPGFGCVDGVCKPCNEFSGNSCNDCPIGCGFNVTSKKCEACINPESCASTSSCCCGYECKEGRCVPQACPYFCDGKGCAITCREGKCPTGFECCKEDSECKKCINGKCGGIGPRTCTNDNNCANSICVGGRCNGCEYGNWNVEFNCCWDEVKKCCVNRNGNCECNDDSQCNICASNKMCGGKGLKCSSNADCISRQLICSNGACCPQNAPWDEGKGCCYNPITGTCEGYPACEEGQITICAVDGCPGTKRCINGIWGECIKNDPNCGVTLVNCNYDGIPGPCNAGIQCNQQCLDGYKCPDPRLPPGQCKTSGTCQSSSECCCGLQCYYGVCCGAGRWRCYS